MQYQLRWNRSSVNTAKWPCRRAQWQVCRVLWSREPDSWDAQWEAEEQLRRQQAQQSEAARQSAEDAAWRQQVDLVHQQLLDQQKHRAALRSRLQQDAQQVKQEQLRRIAPVAKARARARGLASLGLDPQIISLSEKFGKMSDLVDEVLQQVEAQYGLLQQQDGTYGPSSAATAAGSVLGGTQQGGVQRFGQLQQPQPPVVPQQQRLQQQLLQQPERLNAAQAPAASPADNQRTPAQQRRQQQRAAAAISGQAAPLQPAGSLASTRWPQQPQQQQVQQPLQQSGAVPMQTPSLWQPFAMASGVAPQYSRQRAGDWQQERSNEGWQQPQSPFDPRQQLDGEQCGWRRTPVQHTAHWQQQAYDPQQSATTQHATRSVQAQQGWQQQPWEAQQWQQQQPMEPLQRAVKQSLMPSTQLQQPSQQLQQGAAAAGPG